jgi:hypothetical protein
MIAETIAPAKIVNRLCRRVIVKFASLGCVALDYEPGKCVVANSLLSHKRPRSYRKLSNRQDWDLNAGLQHETASRSPGILEPTGWGS